MSDEKQALVKVDVGWIEARHNVNLDIPTPVFHAGVVGSLLGLAFGVFMSNTAAWMLFWPATLVGVAYSLVTWNRYRRRKDS